MTVKIFLFLFLLHTCYQLSAQDLAETTGIVESINKKTFGASEIKIRTPKEDIVLNFDKLDKETQKKLSTEDAQKNKQRIKFNKSMILSKSTPAFGVRANCSEMPTDMGELEDIAKKSSDMLDFLNKIPEGSLQGFTFVTNSLSLHRGQKDANGEGQVSPMWPRVLRTSMDGRITVSFVCDPKNPTFGKVEIINFDDKSKEFKTTEFDFGHPKGKKVEPQDRIHKNPVSCISCHAGSEVNGKTSLKPNWPEYFQWSDCEDDRGIQVYGGNDDNMQVGINRKINSSKNDRNQGCTVEKNADATLKEQENYQKFRELQKNNTCFNSLPWPDNSKVDPDSFEANWSYKYYPYSDVSQKVGYDRKSGNADDLKMNYSLRSNLRLNDTYAHYMGQRNMEILKKSPNYNAVKYFLAMEQAKCRIPDSQRKRIFEILPEMKFKDGYRGEDAFSEYSPYLAQLSQTAGLNPTDWTMNFQDTKDAIYNAGVPNGEGLSGDLKIQDLVGGEVMKDLSATNPTFTNASKEMLSKGVERAFGKTFSCIDDIGGGINPNNKSKKFGNGKLCDLLIDENEINLNNIKATGIVCADCKKVETPVVSKSLTETLEVTVSKLTADQIARGKKLVELDSKGKCVMCHSAGVDMLPKDFRFIPSELDKNKAESVAIIRARKDEIAKKIEKRLIETKTMPPMDNDLTDEDRQDVKAYLLSIAAGK